MEGPGFGVSTDAAILHSRYLRRSGRVNDALSISVEERQVERFIDLRCRHIWDKRTRVINEVGSPGAPACNRSGSNAMCAYHTEVGKQAQTAQDCACDDQHDQPYE